VYESERKKLHFTYWKGHGDPGETMVNRKGSHDGSQIESKPRGDRREKNSRVDSPKDF